MIMRSKAKGRAGSTVAPNVYLAECRIPADPRLSNCPAQLVLEQCTTDFSQKIPIRTAWNNPEGRELRLLANPADDEIAEVRGGNEIEEEEAMATDSDLRIPPSRAARAADKSLDEALKNTFPASDPVAALSPATVGARGGDRPVVSREVEARQGVTGHNVRYVLGWGLAGVILAFAIIYLLFHA
jgi:hypothetical protein